MLDATTRTKLEAVSHTINAARRASGETAKHYYELAIEDLKFLYNDACGEVSEKMDEYNALMQQYSKLADDHIALCREYIASLEVGNAAMQAANDALGDLIETANDVIK